MGWVRTHPIRSLIAVLAAVLVGMVVFLVVKSVRAFDQIAAEEFQVDTARTALDDLSNAEVEQLRHDLSEEQRQALADAYKFELDAAAAEAKALADAKELLSNAPGGFSSPFAESPDLPDDMFDTILLVGSDASGYLADAIVYVLLPTEGSAPIMVSIPRDLYVPNRCTRTYNRINTNLGGCKGLATGSELLALAVEDFTGIEVDHFARVSFDGFKRVVDGLGGVTICVDYPTRDAKSHLDIETPGCFVADGETTLAWVRSRHTEQLIDGEWKRVAASDFARQGREQDVLFQLAKKLSSYSSVGSLATALDNLSYAVRMDSGWSVSEAASLAFRYRGIDKSDVIRLRIPVENYRTDSGALVLLPTATFNDVLAEAYPKAAR